MHWCSSWHSWSGVRLVSHSAVERAQIVLCTLFQLKCVQCWSYAFRVTNFHMRKSSSKQSWERGLLLIHHCWHTRWICCPPLPCIALDVHQAETKYQENFAQRVNQSITCLRGLQSKGREQSLERMSIWGSLGCLTWWRTPVVQTSTKAVIDHL